MKNEPEKFAVPETQRLKALLSGLEGGIVVPRYVNREAVLIDCVRHLMNLHGEDEIVTEILGWLQ